MKKFRLVTLGCKVNQYESQAMRESLLGKGLTETGEDAAEVVVLNTCTVTEGADRENRYWIRRLRRENPTAKIVVTGCWVERNRKEAESLSEVDSVLSNQEKPDLIHLYDWGNPSILEVCLKYAPVIQTALNHGFYCPGGALFLKHLNQPCERSFGPACLASAFLTGCNSIRPNRLFGTYLRSQKTKAWSRRMHWIVLSADQKKRLTQNGLPDERVIILSPGINLPEKISPMPADPVILFVGRLLHMKGLRVLLDALKSVKSPATLLVDGEGPDRLSLEAYAKKIGVANRVRFLGWCASEEHWENYQKSSFVVVPSIWPEPFGLVGIEAMSYSRPVIGSNIGGIPDWLEDEVTGFLVPPGDSEKLAEKIEILLKDPLLAHQMGQQGRQRVEARHNRKIFAEELLKNYQKICQK